MVLICQNPEIPWSITVSEAVSVGNITWMEQHHQQRITADGDGATASALG
jgi:hypothetical protein